MKFDEAMPAAKVPDAPVWSIIPVIVAAPDAGNEPNGATAKAAL